MPVELSFHVLGPPTVHVGDSGVLLGPPLRQALLALLLAHPDVPVSVDQLTAELWGGHPPPSARAQIHNHISALRKAFGGEAAALLRSQPPGYRLAAMPERRDDAAFRRDLEQGRALRAAGDIEAATVSLSRALGRWRGPAYDGVDQPSVRQAAVELDELRLDTVEEWAEAALAVGISADVAETLAPEVVRHPLRERLRGLLMKALHDTGRRADALRVFREGRALMAEELGVEPGAPLQALHQELLGDDWPPRSRPTPVPVQLPADLADFTGRADVADEGLRALAGGTALCLCGPAGIGKTALAVHLAHRVEQLFPDGRILARLNDGPRAAGRAMGGCLRALGVSDAAMPDELEERSVLLRERLAGRAVLVVLDGAGSAEQVRPFLPDAGRAALVVTSRQRLDSIDGLVHLELTLLAEPDAVLLLEKVVGAERIRAEPGACADLVRYCDGLPLALRIAAARLAARPSWTVADLGSRLSEERSRLDWLQIGDRAVRTAFSATCALLAAAERTLFRRLGTLPVREFPAWVAAALLNVDSDEGALVLDRLAEVHLVEPAGRDTGGPRWRMHELLRLFARELADAEDTPAELGSARTRAYDGWLALAQRAGDAQPGRIARDPEPSPCWRPPEGALASAAADPAGWFAAEAAAALAVVRAAAEAGLSRVAWPLAQRLVGFFDRTNRLGDWELACESALLATERAGDVAGRAGMLRLLAAAQRLRGDLAAAQRTATMARDMYAGFDPDRGAAAAGVRLATVHQVRRELDVAAQIAAEALSAARRIGDPILLGNALEVSGSICAYRGESEAALRMLAEALAAYTAGGSEHAIAAMQGGIGLMLKRLGRYSEARAALEEAQQVTDRLGDRSMRAHWDSYLAEVLSVQGHHDEAMQLARAAVQIQRESGDRHSEAVALDVLSEVTLPALGLAAAVPILEEAFRAWRAAGLSPAAALQRLIAACRAAGDEQAAARYAADLQRLAADG